VDETVYRFQYREAHGSQEQVRAENGKENLKMATTSMVVTAVLSTTSE
jgi:hypothetical protein